MDFCRLTPVFALQKLLSECQSHRDCQLPVHHLLFGKDPCPGTAKYLHVDYKCKPSEFSCSLPFCPDLFTIFFFCHIPTLSADASTLIINLSRLFMDGLAWNTSQIPHPPPSPILIPHLFILSRHPPHSLSGTQKTCGV